MEHFNDKYIEKIRLKMKMLLLAADNTKDPTLSHEEKASNRIWLMKLDVLLDEAFTLILTKKGLRNLDKYVPDLGDE